MVKARAVGDRGGGGGHRQPERPTGCDVRLEDTEARGPTLKREKLNKFFQLIVNIQHLLEDKEEAGRSTVLHQNTFPNDRIGRLSEGGQGLGRK